MMIIITWIKNIINIISYDNLDVRYIILKWNYDLTIDKYGDLKDNYNPLQKKLNKFKIMFHPNVE